MLLTLAAALLLQQQTPEQTRQDLGDGLYAIDGQGGRIVFSVGADGTFVVDDQFARVADENLTLIEEVSDGPVVFVLNTHYHGDHTGANAAFTDVGATIVATERVRERLARENTDDRGAEEPSRDAALPVITFSEAMTFHWNGETIRAVSLPDAHTDGDAMVLFEGADVLHAGDVFFSGRFPYIDVEGGGSIDGMTAALQTILAVANPETTIVPGHGPIGDEGDVEETLAMLRQARAAVQARIDAGDDRAAAIAAEPLADLADRYAWAFIDADRMVGQTYDSLTKNGSSAQGEGPMGGMAAAGQPDAGAALDAPQPVPAPEREADEGTVEDTDPLPADPVSPSVPAAVPDAVAPTPNRGG